MDGKVCGMGVLVFYRISYFIGWIRELIAKNVTTLSSTTTTIQMTNNLNEEQTTDSVNTTKPDNHLEKGSNEALKLRTEYIFLLNSILFIVKKIII